MRLFWTLTAAPRPDASFIGLMGVTLATYLVFEDLPVALFGRDISALQLALSVFFFTSIMRNFILNGRIWQARSGKIGGAVAVLLVPVALFWISGVAIPRILQIAFSAYMLSHASVVLAIVKWDTGGLAAVPSVWAKDPRFASQTVSIVAIGDAVFAVTLASIAFFGTELIWVVTMTLGAIVTKMFVNWINVLVVMVMLQDED